MTTNPHSLVGKNVYWRRKCERQWFAGYLRKIDGDICHLFQSRDEGQQFGWEYPYLYQLSELQLKPRKSK